MDLPPPVTNTSFSKIKTTIHTAVTEAKLISMHAAANQEYNMASNMADEEESTPTDDAGDESTPPSDDSEEESVPSTDDDEEDEGTHADDAVAPHQYRDVDVSLDGTWMTRGYSSQIGVVSAIGCKSGEIFALFSLRVCNLSIFCIIIHIFYVNRIGYY